MLAGPPPQARVHARIGRYPHGQPPDICGTAIELEVMRQIEVGAHLKLLFRGAAALVAELSIDIRRILEDDHVNHRISGAEPPSIDWVPVQGKLAAVGVGVSAVFEDRGYDELRRSRTRSEIR